MSPALADGFLSTGSPGKSSFSLFLLFSLSSNQELKARRVNSEAGVTCTVQRRGKCVGITCFPLALAVGLSSPPSSDWPL